MMVSRLYIGLIGAWLFITHPNLMLAFVLTIVFMMGAGSPIYLATILEKK